jgi:hypothetical protein
MPKTETKKIKKYPLVVKNDSEQTYVTGVIGGSSQVDIRLLILEKETFTDEDGNVIMRDISKRQLIMTPPVAATIAKALQNELKIMSEKAKSPEKKKDKSLD